MGLFLDLGPRSIGVRTDQELRLGTVVEQGALLDGKKAKWDL